MRLLLFGAILAGAGCRSKCGEGTHDEDGLCVPDEDTTAEADADTDTDTDADTDADADADTDADADADTDADPSTDDDEDGWATPEDCQDDDPAVNPDAEEICGDGVDNDCDGSAGECAWSGHYAADDAGIALKGEFGGDVTGWDVDGGTDLDGDGFDDVVVGAAQADGEEEDGGSAYVVYGPIEADLSLAHDADARLDGGRVGERLGSAVAMPGDLDGDGADDLLVGAPGSSSNGGAVYLFLGPVSGDLEPGDADRSWEGGGGYEQLGQALGAVGDVSGDGTPDFVLGSLYSTMGSSGNALFWLFTGNDADSGDADEEAAGEFRTDFGSAPTGREVAGAGDVDGDGVDDLLLGSASADGFVPAVAVVPGPITGSLNIEDSADALVTGLSVSWQYNQTLAGGDLNGDGYSDVVIGAVGNSSDLPGEVYALNGPLSGTIASGSSDATIIGPHQGSKLGCAVDAPGDVDGDGAGDLLLTACFDDRYGYGSGASYLVPGPVSGEQDVDDAYSAAFHGPDESAQLWVGVGAGDTNADGLLDLLVGASYTDGDAPTAGTAYVLLGGGS